MVDLIKRFWRKFTYSFCKLDISIDMKQILVTFIKWSRLQDSVVIYAKIVL
jgi:hypothetical protein